MTELANPLSAWESFYVIVGSSGAVLVGLQFVVITLISDLRPDATYETVGSFGTPTVVHLASALLVSAIMSAPWPSMAGASVGLGLCGIAGIVYVAMVFNRARRQTGYKPEWEDWLWHFILPWVVYATMALAAPFLDAAGHVGLFIVGAAVVGLLFIGIHNSWDTILYIVLTRRDAQASPGLKSPDAPSGRAPAGPGE